MFSLICAWINGWVNNHKAGDLRRHHAHYDITVMFHKIPYLNQIEIYHKLFDMHTHWNQNIVMKPILLSLVVSQVVNEKTVFVMTPTLLTPTLNYWSGNGLYLCHERQSGHCMWDPRTRQTDGRTDRVKLTYPPTTSLCRVYDDTLCCQHWQQILFLQTKLILQQNCCKMTLTGQFDLEVRVWRVWMHSYIP